MPGYIGKALTQFNHPTPNKQQDLLYPSAPTKYGEKIQYAQTPVNAPLLDEIEKSSSNKCVENFYFTVELLTTPS